jgi:hypothetical protein
MDLFVRKGIVEGENTMKKQLGIVFYYLNIWMNAIVDSL